MPQPFLKFYLRDWDADAELNSCSLAARGLWMHMLRVMHEAEPYGFFVGRSGEQIPSVQFARRIGATRAEVAKLVGELEAAGVFSRDSTGRIYSRRMVRDEQRRQTNAKNGKAGGNPALIQFGYPNGLSSPDKTHGKSQKPDNSFTSYIVHFVNDYASKTFPDHFELGPPWVHELGVAFNAIASKQMRQLGVDERVLIGRIHALLFGGFRANEAKNRAKGVSLAASFARMAITERLSDLTCLQYTKYATKVVELKNKPFHVPFEIEAVVVYQ